MTVNELGREISNTVSTIFTGIGNAEISHILYLCGWLILFSFIMILFFWIQDKVNRYKKLFAEWKKKKIAK